MIESRDNSGSTDLGVRVSHVTGFGQRFGHAGIPEDMDILVQQGLKAATIDRAPAFIIGQACIKGDLARFLGGNNVDHIRFEVLHQRLHAHGLGIQCFHPATFCATDPADQAVVRAIAIVTFLGIGEQIVHGKTVLGVKYQDLGAGFAGFQVMGNLGGAFIGSGRTAIRIWRRHDEHGTAIRHGLQLSAQDQGLLTSFPGVGNALRHPGIIAVDGIPAEIHAGRQDAAVITEALPASGPYNPPVSVDGNHPIMHNSDAMVPEPTITETDG